MLHSFDTLEDIASFLSSFDVPGYSQFTDCFHLNEKHKIVPYEVRLRNRIAEKAVKPLADKLGFKVTFAKDLKAIDEPRTSFSSKNGKTIFLEVTIECRSCQGVALK